MARRSQHFALTNRSRVQMSLYCVWQREETFALFDRGSRFNHVISWFSHESTSPTFERHRDQGGSNNNQSYPSKGGKTPWKRIRSVWRCTRLHYGVACF